MKKFCIIIVLVLAMSFIVFADEAKEEKVTVKPYGYIKLDAVYETGSSSHGNWAIFAADPGDTDGLWHLTANQTRLGFSIQGISFGDFKVTGKVEVDFYGGNAENKAYNYMRHAFLKISNGSFTIIAGQTWDIINPLNPSTLNYPVLWGAGNMGYRRPQLRFEKAFKSAKSTILLQAGIFRTIAADYDGDGIKDGIAADFPMIQGRISGKFTLSQNASLQLGVSGHYGKTKGVGIEYDTNSLNVDFLLQVSPKCKFVGEFFTGKNLGAFLGGIAQSVSGPNEVEAKGFYINAIAGLSKKATLSVGYGMDDPDDDTLLAGRAKNTTFFGNIVFALSKSVKLGFEVSNWETEYIDAEKQKTLRIQNSWVLSF